MTTWWTALPRRRAGITLLVAALSWTAAACGDDASPDVAAETTASTGSAPDTTPADTTPADTTPADTTPADTTPADTTTTVVEEPAFDPSVGMRGKRYCEVLLVFAENDTVIARVHGTYPLNECPPEAWAALDTAAIAEEQSAVAALANGPRFWLMDRIEKADVEDRPILTFSGLEMRELATVDITELGLGAAPYTEVRVDRAAIFTFDAGSTVFQIVTDKGDRYVMQSWSQQVDPSLDEESLADLGDRLDLPAGWSYEVRVLDEAVTADSTDSPAAVMQDELRNTYSLID